ncbi:MAG: HAD family phosphatase [Candidatus Omnitrophica bacterium]|nr:HAD family phosphatase [Candidatus Omnitrophota bacterium]
MIKGIIFDLGNVLIDFDHRIAAERISCFSDKNAEDIYNLFFDSALTATFEKGKISPQDFFLSLKQMLNLNIDYQTFLPIWNEIFFLTQKNQAVYQLAKGLKSRYHTALLSNINKLHFEYLKDKFTVFDAFHRLFTSYELGYRKPEPEIYEKALGLLGLAPEECFYTDDRQELVEAALKMGINAFVFSNVAKLKESLAETGINVCV